ncbi:hypothetical protein [Streptomyces sp. NPDC002845]
MRLLPTLTQYRTLVIEGHEGYGAHEGSRRAHLAAELAHLGFEIRRMPPGLHHLDPALPYRELLSGPGRLAVDGSIIRELVYGPLRRGRSRVTWIQALDFAEAVAERDGAMLHVTAPVPAEDEHEHSTETAEAATAYARVFVTLAQHVPVLTVDIGQPGHHMRAPAPRQSQLWREFRQLTVG